MRLTQAVEGEIGLIGTEFCFEEATAIYEAAGEAPALKNPIQVHTWKWNRRVIDHTEEQQQSKVVWLAPGEGEWVFNLLGEWCLETNYSANLWSSAHHC